jgi:hypothetical protein
MRILSLLVFSIALNGLAGCQYYQEYRNAKGEADIKEEKAELLRAHRLCLQKYENDPVAAKDRCAPYSQAIQDFEKRSK